MPSSMKATPGQGGIASKLKPVMAPGIPLVATVENQFYIQVQQESYDSAGAPMLHLGAGGEDTNDVLRVTLSESELTPALRQVFIPEAASNLSFLLELADGEPSLCVISVSPVTESGAALKIYLMPYTSVTDISQGDHNGMMQVNLPTTGVITSQIEMIQNSVGYLEYRTLSTTVALSELSSEQVAKVTQAMDFEISPQVCQIMGQILFPSARTELGAQAIGDWFTKGVKQGALCLLQTAGVAMSLYSVICAPTTVAALGAAGGLARGVAFFTGLFKSTDQEARPPVLQNVTYRCAIVNLPDGTQTIRLS